MNHTILHGDVFDIVPTLDNNSIQCVVTSPPYFGLRDYCGESIGHETSIEEFCESLIKVFDIIRTKLKDTGTVFVNIGDSYARTGGWGNNAGLDGKKRADSNRHKTSLSKKRPPGVKETDLLGIPWKFAFAMRDDGWYLRNEIIWSKPNPKPDPAQNRFGVQHEHIFMFTKNKSYFFNKDDAREINASQSGTRIMRNIWDIPVVTAWEKHPAAFPVKLSNNCIIAGTKKDDIVLDPFAGSGTVLESCIKLHRNSINIDISSDNINSIQRRRDYVGIPHNNSKWW